MRPSGCHRKVNRSPRHKSRHLKYWIDQGATSPDNEQPEPDPRQHWAFQHPQASRRASDGASDRSEIRLMLPGRRNSRGTVYLRSRPLRKHVLLRRVYLDSDRLAADARRVAGVSGRRFADRLRNGRRSAAGRSAVRRALGSALDGHLAVQRLVRPSARAGCLEQCPANLALARLDRAVAERRPRLRPHAARDARRRRDLLPRTTTRRSRPAI